MYEGYFGLTERPFSIAPDPHYLYMSARHKEATAHLSYGLSQGGCFIVLTGEVGTGKTTLCRNLLSDLPQHVDVALILNANINELELLQTVCDELKIAYTEAYSQKKLLDSINRHLLATFADNRHTVLIIDEAQLLSRDVLEQIRLLTNLETTKSKLLQIILIGQPELNDLLSRNDLRQLAQRVTARYHLGALKRSEIEDYVNFRLGVAGCKQPLFSRQALNKMHGLTSGIPRKINVLADHALLAAYSKSQSLVDAKIVKRAAQDVFIDSKPADRPLNNSKRWWVLAGVFLLLNMVAWWFFTTQPQGAAELDDVADTPVSVSNLQSESGLESELTPELKPEVKPLLALKPPPELESSELEEVNVDALEPELDNDKGRQSDENSTPEVALTSLTKNAQTQPGTVLVSDEFLDASDSAVTALASAPVISEQDNKDSTFARVLETSADLTGRSVATRVLAKQWGVELPTPMLKASCEEVKQQGLACVTAYSWRQLTYLNRPVMMRIKHQNQFHRVVLTGINGDVATVLVGPNVHRLAVAELRQRWAKKATIYWRPGPAGERFLQFGDDYPQLSKTRNQLNLALSKVNMPVLEDVDSSMFDSEMSQKVFALQTRFGISDDSRVGHQTYFLMNELINPNNTPVLTNRVP